ncbi:MAG: Jag N-terminal domain-containing protein, partial [Clostridia bacterium]|nr:Jag N-terminal domain-containing protein [Clostridia bacterium]
MIIEEIGRGSTLDEAKEDAILKLGISEDEDFEFDIISMPKKKIMGIFGGSDAEVKVWITRPDKPGEK